MIKSDPRHRRLAVGAGLTGLLLAMAACTGDTGSSPSATQDAGQSIAASESETASESAAESMAAGATVTITGLDSFGVDEITVAAGEQLMVVNESSAPHTFTEGENGGEAPDARVNEQIATGASVAVDFPEPGDYNVTCLFHPSMNMVVHVE
jgi:plastocyanin